MDALEPSLAMSGWFTLPRLALSLHWSLPLAPGVAWLRLGAPEAGAAALLVLGVHGLGHAARLRGRGGRVASLRLHALGGEALPAAPLDDDDRAAVARGGVLAQLALAGLAALALRVGVLPSGPVAEVLTTWNLALAAVNLLPLPPFDGVEAWRSLRALRTRAEIARSLAEEDRRWRDDLDAPEDPPPAPEAAPLRGLLETVDPSFDLPDEDIPPELAREVSALLGELQRGEERR